MPGDILLVDVTDRVAVATLNRPEARNALNRDLRRALEQRLGDLDADDAVDVVVLTGADPAFCAGLDLKELGAAGAPPTAGAASGSAGAEAGAAVLQRPFPAMSKPVIGAINGAAVTGGFEVALLCDFLVASERAVFADTHARVGIMPGWGLSVMLPQAVGVRRARELSTTGNFLDAPMALAWGLVNHVVPHDQLLPRARQLAADIVSNDQRAVRTLLRTYDQGSRLAGGDALELEAAVARRWQAGGIDGAEIEARRQSLMERGRSQM
jgi:enoyl-CoA hydratase